MFEEPFRILDRPCPDCGQCDCWCGNPIPKLGAPKYSGRQSVAADLEPSPRDTNYLRFPPKSVDELNSVTARIMAMKAANEDED